jgi:hypothetical protein
VDVAAAGGGGRELPRTVLVSGAVVPGAVHVDQRVGG